MTQTKQFAVIDRDGFGHGNETTVFSTHSTQAAAVRTAKRNGNREDGRCCLMVIAADGAQKGQTIYRDTLRKLYPVVW